jgi:hypothetical protein
MMAGAFILAQEPEMPMWRRIMPIVSSVHFLLGAGLIAAGAVVLPRLYGTGTTWGLLAAAVAIGVLAIAAVIMMLRQSKGTAVTLSIVTAVAAMTTLTLDVVPRLDQLMVSPREAAMVARYAQPSDPPPVLAGYTEPSAVFLLGTETRLSKGRGAAEIAAGQGGLALIEEGQRPAFLAHLAELGGSATVVDGLSGFNYSRGRPVHITLYRVTPPHEITSPPEE